jgi:hypothetical protein
VQTALGRLPPRDFKVLVLTFEEAPGALAGYMSQGTLPLTGSRPARIVTVDESLLPQVRDAYNAFAEAYNATRRVIADHNARGGPQLPMPPAPRDAMSTVRDFLTRVLASARRAGSGGTKATAT